MDPECPIPIDQLRPPLSRPNRITSVNIEAYAWLTPSYRSPGHFLREYPKSPPEPTTLLGLTGKRVFRTRRIQDSLRAHQHSSSRMRRASPISHYALEAAFRVIEHAGFTLETFPKENALLIFAASNGSVTYTRRFFEGICEPTKGGSPLLFPETVYNAPASHLAAILGINNEASTFVSDAISPLQAISAAARLLEQSSYDRCLVIAAEELDPVTCEGYNAWGIAPSIADLKPESITFSEGAGAILLTKARTALECTVSQPWLDPSKKSAAQHFLSMITPDTTAVVSSLPSAISTHSGEALALKQLPGTVTRYHPKTHLGEAIAVSTLWHLCLAAELALQQSHNPGPIAVTVEGFNGQGGVALLRPRD